MNNLRARIIALTISCFLLSVNSVFSQKNTYSIPVMPDVYLISGQLDFLLNEKIINIEFKSDTVTVGRMKEFEFINTKVRDLNNKKAGRGDEWLAEWNEKKSQGELRMIESLNKALLKRNLSFQKDNTTAKYTLLVTILSLEEGWTAVLVNEYATVTLDLRFFETQNPNTVVANLTSLACGKASHLTDAYASNGFLLGVEIKKRLSKMAKAK